MRSGAEQEARRLAQERNEIAQDLLAQGELRPALDALNEAISIAPWYAPSFATRAQVFDQLGMPRQASADRSRAADLDTGELRPLEPPRPPPPQQEMEPPGETVTPQRRAVIPPSQETAPARPDLPLRERPAEPPQQAEPPRELPTHPEEAPTQTVERPAQAEERPVRSRTSDLSAGPANILETAARRLARMAQLDFTVLDDVRAEPAGTGIAIAVVAAASLLAGAGSWLWSLQVDGIDGSEVFLKSLLVGAFLQVLAWLLWVFVAHYTLTRAFGVSIRRDELLRCMAFAFAPVGLSVFIAIRPLAIPFGVVSIGLALLFADQAIRRCGIAEARQSVAANLLGFAAFALVMGLAAQIGSVSNLGGFAPGVFFFSLNAF